MRELLVKIAMRLCGAHYGDLTTVEQQIADLLLEHNYLVKDDNGDLHSTD